MDFTRNTDLDVEYILRRNLEDSFLEHFYYKGRDQGRSKIFFGCKPQLKHLKIFPGYLDGSTASGRAFHTSKRCALVEL